MKIVTKQLLVASCVFSLFVTGVHALEPTFSLVVKAVNDQDLPDPVSSIDVMPGDVMEVLILIKDWSEPKGNPGGPQLRGYQATIAYDGYVSGKAGNLHPVAFDETTDLFGHCTSGGPQGELNLANAFIDLWFTDPNFVFYGIPNTNLAVDSRSCDYRFTGSLQNPAFSPYSDPGVGFYCATLNIEASADARGTFTLRFFGVDPWGWTYLRDEDSEPIDGVVSETLTIRLPNVPEAVSSLPPDGAIDAAKPTDITDCDVEHGWDEIAIEFTADPSGVTAADFTVTVDPADMTPPAIVAVEPDGNAATLRFDMDIPVRHWTVVTYNPTGWSTRIGYLPADVNGDGTSSPSDILDLIDHLNGVITLPPWGTDVDRNAATNSADILTLIDLLNGAGPCWGPWNGEMLP